MNILQQAARRLERLEALDKVAQPLARTVGRAVQPTVVRNLLTGTDLGHPLHPVLTDLPIGAWMMSALLDAADLLVAAGVAAAVPTAAAGLNDWSDTAGPQTRVGLVHAALNTTALSLYLASLAAHARGRRHGGKALSLAGLGCWAARTWAGTCPSAWAWMSTAPRGSSGRTSGRRCWPTPNWPTGRSARSTPVACRSCCTGTAGTVYALASTCSHMGGPLEEGTISDGCVVCPWHGSTFRFADGNIMRGPASTPEPCYHTRIQNGRIEVRAFT